MCYCVDAFAYLSMCVFGVFACSCVDKLVCWVCCRVGALARLFILWVCRVSVFVY